MAIHKLMRQKINVTPDMIFHWKRCMDINLRCLITKHLLTQKDYGNTFVHQDRTFQIVGMGEGRNVMLRETRDEGVFYWECTRHFVQMKLGRFNEEFYQVPKKKRLLTREIPYANYQMYLPPLNKRIKVETLEPEIDEVESVEISYEEDHIANETEE
jgi:hypothetical protein